MTITQTVFIPENRRLSIDVPREVLSGVINALSVVMVPGTVLLTYLLRNNI